MQAFTGDLKPKYLFGVLYTEIKAFHVLDILMSDDQTSGVVRIAIIGVQQD